jgi:hypothetical protein
VDVAFKKIAVSATTTASCDEVYRLLLDRDETLKWSPMTVCEVHKPAPDGVPDSVGEVRRQVMGRNTGYDTLVELVPGKRYVYTNEGLPMLDYRGTVELTPTDDGGCHIDWSSRFRPKYVGTGWLFAAGMRRNLQKFADGLAAYAAKS